MRRKYQHRYVQYARAHSVTCEAMHKNDVKRWPGGCMAGFMLWIAEAWKQFCKQHDAKDTNKLRLLLGWVETDEQFDKWLTTFDHEIPAAS